MGILKWHQGAFSEQSDEKGDGNRKLLDGEYFESTFPVFVRRTGSF